MTLILSSAFLFACPKAEEKKTEPAKTPEKAPVTKTEQPAAAGSSDASCIGAWSAAGDISKVSIAGKAFDLQGAKATETTNDPDDQTVLGVIANIKEDTPENLKNITAILEFFKAEKVDAIVVDGDLGETEAQIKTVLTPIAAMDLPVFVIIGNLEKKADFNNAVKAVNATRSNVINLNFTRMVVLDDAVLVSMPGYYDKSYLHAGEEGCNYKASDVEATKAIIQAAGTTKPVVLISHGPPRQDGVDGIDRMSPGETNVGDAELAKLIRDSGVKFGVFANIQEAGGRGTNVAGNSLVGEGKLADELLLNPGPADAVAWKMNDRTESVGMAATMTVKGKQASFKLLRLQAAAQ